MSYKMICTPYNPTSLFSLQNRFTEQLESDIFHYWKSTIHFVGRHVPSDGNIHKMICENICVRLAFDNSSPTKWYLEIHNRKMTSTEAPRLQNNMNWEHVSLQNHSIHSVYRMHKPLLSVVLILTTIDM